MTVEFLEEDGGGEFVKTYDGDRWVDNDPTVDGEDSESSGLWTPLIPHDVSEIDPGDEDAFSDQVDATLEAHAALIDLFTTLVASGWQVTVQHGAAEDGTPQITLRADAPELDHDRAYTAVRAMRLPTGFSRVEATYKQGAGDGTESWGFPHEQVSAVTRSGTIQTIRLKDMFTFALCSSATWTLTPDLDAPIQRHTSGSSMKTSIVTQPPIKQAPTQDEIDERRRAVDQWATSNDFTSPVHPAMPANVQRALDALDSGNAGYYLLDFTNGDCYLGQSISIADRLKGHRSTHKDIRGIRLRPDIEAGSIVNPLRHLLDHEATLIHSVQQAGLPARNKAQMTYAIGDDSSLDDIFRKNGTTSAAWLADPIGVNAHKQIAHSPNQSRRSLTAAEDDYRVWLKRTGEHADTVRSLLRTYMERCLPLPRHTEYQHWVLSSPRNTPYFRTLSNLSIRNTEAFRTMIDKDKHLRGMLHVNGVELLGESMSDDALIRFMRQHPGVCVTETDFQEAGPFNLMLWAPDLTSIDDLLDDTAVTRAAATAALHLMKKGKMGKNKNSHNPVLVNAILRTTGQ
ncbi:GIY-YIG nuclease family protein [Gordonia sp. w5E2]|uniref:GIY-YIG nuclease family protein n=1 Tax=Gordonia sp. w5E2 TaxID=3075837 RepID=UPI00128EF15F